MRLSANDVAPDFELLDADESTFSSMTLRGQRAILYFYPAALTPGCTRQACDFRDNLDAFKGAALTVVGISPDPPEKLRKFRETHDLPFTLLSDPDHKVLEAYGAWGEKKLYGKTVVGVIRSTVVLGPQGLVEHAFYNVKATGHVAKLLRDLKLAA
ncbi:MAG TPA: thioredoxin-dependent thiol peroxidase [Mycobacteriales bacterium]|jgi:peroxiredoxin Q/BCP|nr:thioredoxin-dependent thiol peroxidase [Mycobacteriales bacterium]